MKLLNLRQTERSSRRRGADEPETCPTSSCGTSGMEGYGTNEAPGRWRAENTTTNDEGLRHLHST